MSILKTIFSTLFLIVKIPLVILMAIVIGLLHLLKYLLVHPKLIRISERLIDRFVTRIVLKTFAVMRAVEVYHKDDSGFDFVKARKGELVVDRKKYVNTNEATLIIANDTSVLEYLWLQVSYSPMFVTMDYDKKQGMACLRPIGRGEIIHRACGINFPEKVQSSSKLVLYKSFKEVSEAMYVKNRPIVFFPECTRSNGKGVLEPPKEAVEFIKAAIYQDKFAVHAFRFDYSLGTSSMQPYNSTDTRGLKHALIMLAQFLNKMHVQYFFNLHKSAGWSQTMSTEEMSKKLKEALFSKGREYNLDKDWHDHQEFLKYWAENQ